MTAEVTAKWPETIRFIDLKGQYQQVKPLVDARMQAVLDHGQYIMGPEVAELETELAEFVGVKHGIGVGDGTTALLVAMMGLGIKAGDEVITTPFTFIATGEMISLLGAVPVFADIDPITYNIDPNRLEAAITPKTRAIIPVSLYGQPADFNAINAIADKHGLPVIDDAAQSFGASYHGRRAGGLSTVACTSFFPSKPLGCYGDGGMCFTNDDDLAQRMRQIRVHGQEKRYVHSAVGINGRLDTLQAAVVLAKMSVFEQEIAARQEAGDRYTALIRATGLGDQLVPPSIAPGLTSVYAQYTVRVQDRAKVVAALGALDIPTAVHYPVCLHHQPVYKNGKAAFVAHDLVNAERAAEQVMSLPMYPGIDAGLQSYIVDALAGAI